MPRPKLEPQPSSPPRPPNYAFRITNSELFLVSGDYLAFDLLQGSFAYLPGLALLGRNIQGQTDVDGLGRILRLLRHLKGQVMEVEIPMQILSSRNSAAG